jgi:hypothetical protein
VPSFARYVPQLYWLSLYESEIRAWWLDKNLIVELLYNYKKLQENTSISSKEKFDATSELLKSFISTLGTIATIIGGLFVFWDIKLTQSRLITDRFSKAVEQLGNNTNLDVRIGGIYSLEKISEIPLMTTGL